MLPVPGAESRRVNWQNYKTGVPSIFFRMRAERGYVSIGIELTHKDTELQELYFEQLRQFRKILENYTLESWEWTTRQSDETGQSISSIGIQKDGVDVMKEEDWAEMISFLKPRIIALDGLWAQVKPGFEN